MLRKILTPKGKDPLRLLASFDSFWAVAVTNLGNRVLNIWFKQGDQPSQNTTGTSVAAKAKDQDSISRL